MAILAKNMKLENTKAIVFDWNGTLYNNTAAIKAAIKDVLTEYNINYPLDDAVEQALSIIEGIDSSDMPNIILNAYTLSDGIEFMDGLHYIDKLKLILKLYINYKRYNNVSQLFSGADQIIAMLAEKFDLALLTSEKKDEIIEMLKKFKLDIYFKSVITNDEIDKPKSPEAILKAIRDLKYDPKEVIYVGDLLTDILAAKQANVNTIAIANGLISTEILNAERPNIICNHITDLSAVFNLPEIHANIEKDYEIYLKIEEERIKKIVHVDFDWISLLKKAFPKKLESHLVKKIVRDPLGFIGALLRDVINLYTDGEIELKEELEIFSNRRENDLLKCLGLIIIHFVNERSNNLLKKIAENKILKTSFQLNYSLFTFLYMNSYPIESKIRLKKSFLNIFDRIIPDDIKYSLQNKTPDEFASTILEGIELALKDLNIETVRFPRVTNILKIPLIPLNLVLGRINDIIEFYYDSSKKIVEDILTNDFRDKPKLITD
ncbi:MAG: HAD family hydrolase [Candidatus Helarchaeota archaeon]